MDIGLEVSENTTQYKFGGGFVVGIGIGIALGVLLDSLALGAALGMGIGTVLAAGWSHNELE